MANNRLSKYTIELDIEQSDRTRSAINDIEKSLKNISDSTKDGLSDGLASASKQADTLITKVKELAKSETDSTKEIEAFNKAANKTIFDLEKQATDLNYSLSEQGKLQRSRLKDLQAELQTLGKTGAEKKRAKEIEREIKAIQKDVVVGSDAELKAALDKNKSIRANLKLTQQESKILQAQAKQNKALSLLVKDDLKAIRDKIKAQTAFIQTLKTTEGRYKAIKKAAFTVGKGALKGAGIVGGGLIGGALALGGMAVGNANNQVERERESNRIKANITPDEKQSLLGEMYIKTGADYTTIVDAINRVTSVLGVSNRDDIAQAAITEIRYPGAAALFRQQNTGKATANDFNTYTNRLKAVQGATGASVDQVQASTEKIANLRQKNFSNASMTDLQSIYLALQNSGAYDNQDELDRAFNSFLRAQRSTKEDIFDFAQRYFTNAKTQTRGVYGATNRQQAITALSNLDWRNLRNAANTDSVLMPQTAAEKTAQKMREIEEKKNEILMKMVEAIAPVIEAIDVKELSTFFESMIKLAKDLAPAIAKIVSFITGTMSQLVQSVVAMYEGLKNSKLGQWIIGDDNANDWFTEHSKHVSGFAEANGGLVTMPSIAGERGAEMVVPLDYSRNARGAQLTQNLVQHFNMQGSETTALSLSQAVRSRDFTRAMMNNAFISGRMGR